MGCEQNASLEQLISRRRPDVSAERQAFHNALGRDLVMLMLNDKRSDSRKDGSSSEGESISFGFEMEGHEWAMLHRLWRRGPSSAHTRPSWDKAASCMET